MLTMDNREIFLSSYRGIQVRNGMNYPHSLMKKYKFITIKQVDDEIFEKHPVYRIFNNRSNSQLGIISFYKPWKEYVFSSQPECVFNNSCLTDVLDFINNHTK